MRVVFLGSADFGLPAVERILADGHQIAAVVTTPDRPKGRGLRLTSSPVADFAAVHGLSPVLKPADLADPGCIRTLDACHADVFVVVAYRILPEAVFSLPPLGTLNIHASLLPRYRGPAPIQRAIEAGEAQTGITIFRLDRGVDTGGILAQEKVTIEASETTPKLYHRLSLLGASALACVLSDLPTGRRQPMKQDDALATRAPKLNKLEARVDWNLSSSIIFNKIRAFKPFPGTHTFFAGKRLGIEWGTASDAPAGDAPGTICAIGREGFDVACGQGVLRVTRVKPEGKPEMGSREFMRGTTVEKGTRLE
jgi:methionyl-tRNA formyltransferase